ncbi:MAG: tyrosine-type recombinase/integrase [Nitrospirae bacterium]|nr:tyrosine-type recombinase/integrase [Nitrospirota bacterium]
MGLYRRDKTYWFSITYRGQRIQESTGTDNRKLAEKIYAKTLMDIVEGRFFESSKLKQITFDQMVEKYLEQYEKQRDARTAKTLKPFFSGLTLSQISPKVIGEYRRKRLEKVKPATVYQELALMRRMFNVAIKEWEWLNHNPVSKLSFSVGNRNARDRWLSDEEEKKLVEAATNPWWLRNCLVVAMHTGMRRGEILNLKWQDVSFDRKTVAVVKSKNGEKRTIPMSKTVFDTLNSIKVKHISGGIFPISGWSLRQAFDNTVEKAGIENFRFHDLRHTFATRLVQNGVGIYKVKELLGHKTILITMRYAHHYPESLRSSVELLDICYKSATILDKIDKVNAEKPLRINVPEWRNWQTQGT